MNIRPEIQRMFDDIIANKNDWTITEKEIKNITLDVQILNKRTIVTDSSITINMNTSEREKLQNVLDNLEAAEEAAVLENLATKFPAPIV